MVSDKCPDTATIEKYFFGQFESEQDAREVEAHLESCDKCAQATLAIAVDETLLQSIRKVSSDPEDLAQIEQAIEKGKELAAEIGESDRGVTQLSSSQTPSPHSVAETQYLPELDDANTSFLRPAEQPGELGRLGNYRVLQLIGYGGMGIVFRAEDITLQRVVALKVMKPAFATSREAKDRFLTEARATAAIEHDNLVDIYQVGEDAAVPYLAMQFLQGQSLQDRLDGIALGKQSALGDEEILSIVRQAAEGLHAAHSAGLIHRDIKPDNIWIQEQTGRVKILDFGLARANDNPGLTQAGQILGTPRYMSPEQAQGETVDHRSDLFSLGCVLYRLVTGHLAFDGKNTPAVLIAVAKGDYVPVLEHRPDADPELVKLVDSLLAREVDDRPASAEVVIRLVIAIEGQRITVEAGDGPIVQVSSGGSGTVGSRRGQSNALPWGIAALLLLLLICGWYAYEHRDKPTTVAAASPSGNVRTDADAAEPEPVASDRVEASARVEAKPAMTRLSGGATDREVAEWIRQYDSAVRIVYPTAPGNEIEIPVDESLPDDEWQLVAIHIDTRSLTFSYEELEQIGQLQHVRQIALHNVKMPPDGLTKFANLPLERLTLNTAQALSDAEVDTLANMSKLYELAPGVSLTAAQIERISACKSITMLNFYSASIEDSAVKMIAETMPQVIFLELSHSLVSDESLPALSGMSKLDTLHISGCDITDAGIQKLADCQSLTHLSVGSRSGDLTAEGARQLSENLRNCLITAIIDEKAFVFRGGSQLSGPK